MKPYVALLRAVNVGGTGKLPMKELRAACEEAGFGRVSTYIASGNVVFESSKSAARVQAILTELLRDRFGLTKNEVIIREPEQLARIVDRNPFPEVVRDRPKLLHVSFLAGKPAAGAAKALAAFKGPERMHLDGEHLYIDFPNGAGKSKLTPAFLERALGVKHTARNWSTVGTLLEMVRDLSA